MMGVSRGIFRCTGILTAGWILSLLAAAPAFAQGACAAPVAKVVSAQGEVTLDRAAAELDDPICPGVIIEVGSQSRAAILLLDQNTVLRIDQNTRYVVAPAEGEDGLVVELLRGVIHFFSNVPRSLRVRTPFVNATVEGTEFLVDVDESRTDVSVVAGRVRVNNDRGELLLADGEAAYTGAGGAPSRRTLVNPRDGVQWALYYPPVGIDETAAEATRKAAELLAVGRVEEASALLQASAAANPADAVAPALEAIIAIIRNRLPEALALAREATAIAPGSTVAHTALSYALQADYRIDEALASARTASVVDPESAFAWARLSELQLASGDARGALASARRAVELEPRASRTQGVLGFAQLAHLDTDSASTSFERAIAGDSADPLPRLGLGLALIKRDEFERGREQIEIAAGLDPGNSLIRSYLGKAYFEQGREDVGRRQLDIARQLDPGDPTPWLYDALHKHATNRPVAALRDLKQSMALNDNRAVYRSRLLLDEDLATRGASLARVFDTLGFRQAAVVEAAASIAVDPANHSAHRFLADSFAGLPRHELARASELLRSQLLQPLNVNPVQPAFVESDLNAITDTGPASVGFNEFTPLFVRNRPHLLLAGAAGSNDSRGTELVVSGVEDRFSYSVARSSQSSDGIRPNNDYENDIDNAFGQVSITPSANLQFEYRRRETDRGDVSRNFDPQDFSPLDRFVIESETPRLGLRLSPSPQSDLLLSWIRTDRTEDTFQFLGGPTVATDLETRADDYSAQYIVRRENWNLVAGLSSVDIDREEGSVFDQTPLMPPGACPPGGCLIVDRFTTPIEQESAYLYVNLLAADDLRWTVGGSYDRVRRDSLDASEFNPKLGLQWDLSPMTTLRAAYFGNLRRTVLSQQILEPTQIAGFNQLFDDFDGTDTRSSALGIDWSATPAFLNGGNFHGGVELVHRDIDLPLLGLEGGMVNEAQNEDELRAYAYATIGERWSLTAELSVERFDREAPLAVDPLREVETISLPLTLRYFAPNGFFAGIRATYLDQELTSDPPLARNRSDSTALADLAVGYRLPGRRGLVSFEIRNLFDSEFRLQDQNNRAVIPQSSRFLPERTFLARVTLNF